MVSIVLVQGIAFSMFVPELVGVDMSAGTVAPGHTVEMTYYCRNAGTQPSINYLTVAVKFIPQGKDDLGFFNPDGGAWFGGPSSGMPFQSDLQPSLPTTQWQSGTLVTEGPARVTVPDGTPEGTYDILIWFYDRGGRVSFGPQNDAIKRPKNNCLRYKIGELHVSNTASEPVPVRSRFIEGVDIEPQPPKSEINNTAEKKDTRPAASLSPLCGKPLKIGTDKFAVILDQTRNYALSSVVVEGTVFETGSTFPAIAAYDQESVRTEFFPADPRWTVKAEQRADGIDVLYSMDGFAVKAAYTVLSDRLQISIEPVEERRYKILLVSGGGSFIHIPADKTNALKTGFILSPQGGGARIEFPEKAKMSYISLWQSWVFPASFLGVGCNGSGLILRCPQYGGAWSYGTGDIHGSFSLFIDCAVAFRPSSSFFNMPLAESKIEFQLVPVGDTNKDGTFNWVDMGVHYRNLFIRPNKNKDYKLRDSVLGKIGVDPLSFSGVQNYSQLIEQIKTIDFAPQTIWLVGAHTPAAGGYVDPPYTQNPDPSHNGPNSYDYFAFKKDAEKAGARIGIHELFQDVSERNDEWGARVPLKLDEYGNPKGTWGGVLPDGKKWQVYAKALNVMIQDGSFFRSIDKHFEDWDVRPGDTWHWDCLTAMGGQQDYSPDHPATNGSDIRECIKVLKYIKSKGVYMTSEGLQEGMAEFCDMAWSAQINLSLPWGGFEKAQTIPLTPVLFQGMTYYCFAYKTAYSLLYGGKGAYEMTRLPDRESIVEGYFSSDVFWPKIADRTVNNMIKTEKGWKVEYTEGGTLDVDLADMSDRMTFVLNIDGETFTPNNPPASPWGVIAKRGSDGKYQLEYPKKNND